MRENLCCLEPDLAMRGTPRLVINPPAAAGHTPALGGLRRLLGVWARRVRTRGEMARIADDERLLRDIGLRRDDALRQARRPFWRA